MSAGLIVALDVETFDEAKAIVDSLTPSVGFYKVGSTLFTYEGKKVVEYIHSKGAKVFLDLKFFDIPNQVKGVSKAAASLGVEMFTIHLIGGREMIRGAIEGAVSGKQTEPPIILGVTILTSMNDRIVSEEMQIGKKVEEMVPFLVGMGMQEGLKGFVCSPFEIESIKSKWKDAILVTPGIRLPGESAGDQKRVMTPSDAKRLGANYIVMGRSILDAKDRQQTAYQVVEMLQ